MPNNEPDKAHAVVYLKHKNGRWTARLVDAPDVTIEAADIDDAKTRISAAARKAYSERDNFPLSVSVVGYVHPGKGDNDVAQTKTSAVPSAVSALLDPDQ